MHKVLVNRLGGLSLPRKSVVRLTDRPDMTLDVDRGPKTTMQQQQQPNNMHVRMRKFAMFQQNYMKVLKMVDNLGGSVLLV